MFSCKACACKSEHIADLKAQLTAQTQLVRDLVAPRHQQSPNLMLEANNMLDGAASEQIEVTPERKQELSAIEKQAADMLSGLYN